jgi:glutamate/tyrosine decarboxylase-like PLP-dependent enzyme
LALYLAERVGESDLFELKAPVTLKIICFGDKGEDASLLNRAIVEHLHVSGKAAPSLTILNNESVIRCAIVNHRTSRGDIDAVVIALENSLRFVTNASIAQMPVFA